MKPAYKQDLNFIPDEILKEKKVQSQTKSGFKTGLTILIVVGVISAIMFFYSQALVVKNNRIESEIKDHEETIARLKVLGEKGYNLGVRLESIKKVLNERESYSVLYDEVNLRTPVNVVVSDYNVTPVGDMSIRAISSPNFTPIALFQDRLLTPEDEMDTLFPEVKIGSAALAGEGGKVNFDLKVKVNMEDLHEKIE